MHCDVADGDDILVRSNGPQSGGADLANGMEAHVRGSQPGYSRQMGNELTDWEEEYRRMTLDDRIQLELSSIGLLPGQSVCGQIVCLLIRKWVA